MPKQMSSETQPTNTQPITTYLTTTNLETYIAAAPENAEHFVQSFNRTSLLNSWPDTKKNQLFIFVYWVCPRDVRYIYLG